MAALQIDPVASEARLTSSSNGIGRGALIGGDGCIWLFPMCLPTPDVRFRRSFGESRPADLPGLPLTADSLIPGVT